jgi:hypothetical protein
MDYKFSVTEQIKEKSEIIFDFTQDYNKRLIWDTFLLEAKLLPPATAAEKGAKAWCVAVNGYGMETEYVSFLRPKVTAIKMTKGPYMLKEFAGSWTFNEIAPGITTVTFVYSFSLRFPYTLIGPWIRRDLTRNVQQRLSDLKECIEQKKM